MSDKSEVKNDDNVDLKQDKSKHPAENTSKEGIGFVFVKFEFITVEY